MGERDDGRGPMSPEVAVMVLQSELEASPAMVAEAVTALAGLVDSVMASPYGDVVDSDGRPMVWHFVGYRPDAAELGKHTANTLNAPESPQYQGVIFADGTCVLRWLTAKRSWSVWDSFAEMFTVHGHPEYGTRIVWPSGDAPADALEVIAAAEEESHQRRVEELKRERAAEAEEAVQRDLERLQRLDAGIVRTDSGEHYDPTQDNTGPELPDMREDADRSGGMADALDALADEAPDPPLSPDNTLGVCLDCTDYNTPTADPLVNPFTDRASADLWLRMHQEANPHHRAVTVPGWPPRSVAVAVAQSDTAGGAQ